MVGGISSDARVEYNGVDVNYRRFLPSIYPTLWCGHPDEPTRHESTSTVWVTPESQSSCRRGHVVSCRVCSRDLPLCPPVTSTGILSLVTATRTPTKVRREGHFLWGDSVLGPERWVGEGCGWGGTLFLTSVATPTPDHPPQILSFDSDESRRGKKWRKSRSDRCPRVED